MVQDLLLNWDFFSEWTVNNSNNCVFVSDFRFFFFSLKMIFTFLLLNQHSILKILNMIVFSDAYLLSTSVKKGFFLWFWFVFSLNFDSWELELQLKWNLVQLQHLFVRKKLYFYCDDMLIFNVFVFLKKDHQNIFSLNVGRLQRWLLI